MKSVMTYENYVKCFAGVYRKHAGRDARSFFTCYVRGAVLNFCENEHKRQSYLEHGSGEDACGYRVAVALLRQGWPESKIIEHTDEMQGRVDAFENSDSPLGFTEKIEEEYGYPQGNVRIQNSNNQLRWNWMQHGAPYLEDQE